MNKVIQLNNFVTHKPKKVTIFKRLYKSGKNMYRGLNKYFFGDPNARFSEVAWFYGGVISSFSLLIGLCTHVNNII